MQVSQVESGQTIVLMIDIFAIFRAWLDVINQSRQTTTYSESEEEAGFADAGVADHEDLEEVVAKNKSKQFNVSKECSFMIEIDMDLHHTRQRASCHTYYSWVETIVLWGLMFLVIFLSL